jgi:hypothetical protein
MADLEAAVPKAVQHFWQVRDVDLGAILFEKLPRNSARFITSPAADGLTAFMTPLVAHVAAVCSR